MAHFCVCRRAFILMVCEKMFTVGETQPISDANERKQQTQPCWIQYVAGIPFLRTFTTETLFRARRVTGNSVRVTKKKTRTRNHGAGRTLLSTANSNSLDSSCHFGCEMTRSNTASSSGRFSKDRKSCKM